MLINIPSGETNQLKGIIDLPSFLHIEYLDDKGKRVNLEKIDKGHQFFERAYHYRNQLIEQLANYDDELGDLYLSGTEPDQIDQDLIDKAIRKALVSQKAVPLFCGSALKNKGIQPLLDGIVKYLPSPENVEAKGIDNLTQKELIRKPSKKEKLCALAFKVVNDREKGLVTFLRLYSGSLKNRQKI